MCLNYVSGAKWPCSRINQFYKGLNVGKDPYVPQPKGGGGHNIFGADPVGRLCSFIAVHYFLNQLMDFDQTCIDTLMGGQKELI